MIIFKRFVGTMLLFIICITIVIWQDSWPTYHQWQMGKIKIQELQKKIAILQLHNDTSKLSIISLAVNPFEKSQLLALLTRIFDSVGVVSQNLHFEEGSKLGFPDAIHVAVELTGSFAQVEMIIRQLISTNHSIAILNYSWQMASYSQIHVSMDLLSMSQVFIPVKFAQINSDFKNPFCSGYAPIKTNMTVLKHLDTLSINLFKMVGYINQASQPSALLQLPDGATVQVKLDQFIGIEHARIFTILSHKLVVMLPSREQRVITWLQ